MYTDFYQLTDDPFRLTPDVRFLFPHRSFRDTYAKMQYALERADGVLVVTGQAGTGKSSLADCFLAEQKSKHFAAASLVGTHLGEGDVLRMVAYEFGLDANHKDKAALLHELKRLLSRKSRSLLIADEAHNLTDTSLEELCMLANLHVDARPLLQLFLIGQPSLQDRLRANSSTQLRQHLLAVCEMQPLCLKETYNLVLHRLSCAGWRGDPALTADALIFIHRYCQGLPRYICKLCSRLLFHGAVERRHQLTADDVLDVAKSLEVELLLPSLKQNNGDLNEVPPEIGSVLGSMSHPVDRKPSLTDEEHTFLSDHPALITEYSEGIAPARELVKIERPPATEHSHQFVSEEQRRFRGAFRAMASELQNLWHLKSLSQRVWSVLPKKFTILRDRIAGNRIVGYLALLLVSITVAYEVGLHNSNSQMSDIDAVQTVPRSPASDAGNPVVALAWPERDNLFSLNRPMPNLSTVVPLGTWIDALLSRPTDESSPVLILRRDTSKPLSAGTAAATAGRNRSASSSMDENSGEMTATAHGTTGKETAFVAESQTREEQITELLKLAESAISNNRLRTPEAESAWRYYQDILKLDPGNPSVTQGLHRIATRYALLARTEMEKQEYDLAQLYITRGLSVVDTDSALLSLQEELTAHREALAQQAAQATAETGLAEEPPEEPEPESEGFFAAIKRLFTGGGSR